MATSLKKSKPLFGVPSLEIAGRIDDVDKVTALEAATYRCSARMRELEAHFEVKAAEIRASFLAEVADAVGVEEAAE